MANRFLFFLQCILLCSSAFSQKVNIGNRPLWTAPLKLDYTQKIEQDDVSGSYLYFLYDFQVNAKLKTEYCHYAYKIFNNKGVEDASTLYFSYEPEYQKLIIHSLKVIRNNVVIDKLKTSKIDDIQREERLEEKIYDGGRTVSVIIDDVRSGDIIEYDYSIQGTNPIFNNKFYYSFYINNYNTIKKFYCKIIKPKDADYTINFINKRYEPIKEVSGDSEVLLWSYENIPGLKCDEKVPYWYEPYDLVQVSEYGSWEDVVEWGREVFKNDCKLPQAFDERLSSFKSIISPEVRLMKALRYVQDEIRYFGIEIGVNSHKPKAPEKVISSGYGDCKDKTFLLISILKELDIQAFPVLVNSTRRKNVFYDVPSPSQFNHVIVCAQIKGNQYFLDPTIQSQRGDIHSFYTPNYFCGLVIADSVRALSTIPVKSTSEVKLEERYKLNSLKGDASLVVKTFYTGGEADNVRYQFSNSNLNDIQKKYLKYYEDRYDDVESNSKFTFKDNEQGNIIVSTENYKIKKVWNKDETDSDKHHMALIPEILKEFLDQIDISAETRNYPLALPFPDSRQHIIEIDLPDNWDIDYAENTVYNEYFKYEKRITYINKKLRLAYMIKILKSDVAPADYVNFRTDLQKVYDDFNFSLQWNEKLDKQTKSSNVNWILVFVAVLFAVICSIGLIFYVRGLKKNASDEIVPMRLGGWLVLPFIGLLGTVILVSISLFTNNFFNKTLWLIRTDESSPDYISGFSFVLTFELCVNIILFFLALLLLIGFIRNYRIVPRIMIFYYLFYLTFTVVDHVFVSIFISHDSIYYLSKDIIKALVASCIWIPYFICSERVKATFVR